MTKREFPSRPLVGVGAVILHGTGAEARVLLARRGRAPSLGEWSIPGGLVKVGESLEQAVAREVLEETGLRVRVGEMIELLDRIIHEEPKQGTQSRPGTQRNSAGAARATAGTALKPLRPGAGKAPRVQYHYVIIDYLCRLAPRCAPSSARAGSDATELRWITRAELRRFDLRPVLRQVLRKAFTRSAQARTSEPRA